MHQQYESQTTAGMDLADSAASGRKGTDPLGYSQVRVRYPLTLDRYRAARIHRAMKRLIDIAGSLTALAIFSPVLAACAILVVLSSRGPVIYRHKRIGRFGRTFWMWKFRSMCQDADRVLKEYLREHPEARREWNELHKLTADPRLTTVGRVMRRFSLDELPQLWNVLTGEMSLVGPRPIVAAEVGKYEDAIGAYYAVRPGMTGLWQVSGRNDTSYAHRVALDKHYVAHWSWKLELLILAKTVQAVVSADGAY